MNEPVAPIRLNNVFAGLEDLDKISGTVSKEVYTYFFRHLVAGHRGPVQACVSIFFQKFYDHVKNVEQIPACWDEENETKLAVILSRLNFHDVNAIQSELASLRTAQEIPHDRGTPGGRRSAPRTPKPKREPSAPKRDRAAAGSTRDEGSDDSGDAVKTKKPSR